MSRKCAIVAGAMEARTHLAIDPELVGKPIELAVGMAKVGLTTRADMAADDRGLVHGGFVFGLADYAAMLAINDPNVVLGSADTRFTAPVTVGDEVVAHAQVSGEKGRKRVVDVRVAVGDRDVFSGTFTCFVLEHHVLAPKE